MSNLVGINAVDPEPELIERAAAIIRSGGLVAFPTETVYGLGASAVDPEAVARIFEAKERPGWDPLIVHVNSQHMARSLICKVPLLFYDLAERFWPGPLTLVIERSSIIPDLVTAGRSTVALRMPRHPVIQALLGAANLPIAAPSANRFSRPSPTRATHVLEDLGERVDLILDGGYTALGVESTVLDLTCTPPAILRPGAITAEMIETVIGPVQAARPVIDETTADGQASPGLSNVHYSPRAKVETFESAAGLMQRMAALQHDNQRVGVLDNHDDLPELAHNLFARLRQFDTQNVNVILCLLPPAEGLGVAIRDRLQRASGLAPDQPAK